MNNNIIVKQVTFESIQEQWMLLEEAGDVPTVFQTYEWVSTWWNHFSDKRTSLLLAAFENDNVVGIAPCFIERMKIKGVPFFTILRFMGTPQTDYNAFIAKKGYEQTALDALVNGLKRYRWDVCWFSDVNTTTSTEPLLAKVIEQSGFACISNNQTPCPYVSLPQEYVTYQKTLSGTVAKNSRYYLSKLAKLGTVELSHCKDIANVESDINSFFKLHEKRWNRENQKGALHEERVKLFHIEASKKLMRYLELAFLSLNDNRIACQYGYCYNGVMYSYLKGMDPDYQEYRVGNTLQFKLIEYTIQRGLREYDMLRGDESYKYHFTKTQRYTKRYVFSRSKLKLMILRFIESALR